MTENDRKILEIYLQNDKKAQNILNRLILIDNEMTKKSVKLKKLRYNQQYIIMFGAICVFAFSNFIEDIVGRGILTFIIEICLLVIILPIINRLVEAKKVKIVNELIDIYDDIDQNDIKYINAKLKESKIKEQIIKEDKLKTTIYYLQINTHFSINGDFITANEIVEKNKVNEVELVPPMK